MHHNWKFALKELKKIYSDNQIAIVLGLSHGAVAGRILKFMKTNYKNKILDVYNRIRSGTDPREILFDSWSERHINNFNALVIKKLREDLNLSLKKIGSFLWASPNTGINIVSYESGVNIMPDSFFRKIISAIKNNMNIKLHDKVDSLFKKAKKYEFSEQKQVIKFKKIKHKIPSAIKLIYPSKHLEYSKSEFDIYNKLKNRYKNVFLGVKILPKNFKGKRETDIDILIVDKINYVVEIKDWKNIKWNTLNRRLNWTNYFFRNLRKDFKEIDKTVCILPNIKISNSFRRKFNIKENLIFGKNDNLELDTKLSNPESYIDKRRMIFNKNRKMNFRDIEIVYLRNLRKLLKISLTDLCNYLNIEEKHKTILSGIETGHRPRPSLKEEYIKFLNGKKHLKSKNSVKKLVENELKSWDNASKFPMVIGLAKPSGEGVLFENQVEQLFKNKRFITVRNVWINDKNLSWMTTNNHHPEIDIIAKKNGKLIGISCKDGNRAKAKNQFLFSVKREIEKLSQLKEDTEFDKMMIFVSSDLPDTSWKEINEYANTRNVEFKRADLHGN